MILGSSQNRAIKGIQRSVSYVGLGEEITKGFSEETHFELRYEGSIQMNQAKLKGAKAFSELQRTRRFSV